MKPLQQWGWAILHSDTLGPNARHAAHVLALHMDAKVLSCYPGIATIAREMKRSKTTAAEAVDELERKGFVRRHKGGRGKGDVTLYYVAIGHVLLSGTWSETKPKRPPARGTKRAGSSVQTGRPKCPASRTEVSLRELQPAPTPSASPVVTTCSDCAVEVAAEALSAGRCPDCLLREMAA